MSFEEDWADVRVLPPPKRKRKKQRLAFADNLLTILSADPPQGLVIRLVDDSHLEVGPPLRPLMARPDSDTRVVTEPLTISPGTVEPCTLIGFNVYLMPQAILLGSQRFPHGLHIGEGVTLQIPPLTISF